MTRNLIIALIIFGIPALSFGQLRFIENKNQWEPHILYKMKLSNGSMFLEKDCITFNFINREEHDHSFAHHGATEENHQETIDGHAYRVTFIGANNDVKVESSLPSSDYLNYYIGNDPSRWAGNVKQYQEILYHNLYDNIDLKLYITDKGLKYDFIVHPNGDVDDIVLEYEGAGSLTINNNNLVVTTTVNDVVELQPLVYQIIEGEQVAIPCIYNIKKNRVNYKLDRGYDTERTLVVDPSLVFSTYTGSTGDNWGFTATWDFSDNVYSGGIVFDVGYPTTLGAYQVNFAGGTPPIPNSTYYALGCDVGIIKYNENGTQRLFATYLGGSGGQEMPHSLVVTEENDLVVMGTTGSPDFPTTAGAYDNTFNGGDSVVYDNVVAFSNGVDIYVAKFSSTGSSLMGSTYVGGSGNDGLNFKQYYAQNNPVYNINWTMMHGNDSLYFNYADGARGEVICDSKGDIYVATNTFSMNFPQGINNGFQTSSGGKQDGIVFKLKGNLSQLIWSSYLGGSEDDAIYSLDIRSDDNIYVAGGTVSTNFPTTFGAYKTSFQGGTTDGFVAEINADGNQLLASSYFGSNQYDQAYFVRTDDSNNPFICGQTKATGSTLIFNASYNEPNSGQFIAKFQPNLSAIQCSTVFGTGSGQPNISITAFAVDICNRIYLAGWGRIWPYNYYNSAGQYYAWTDVFGTKGMDITADAIQSNTDGQDFYIMVLSEDASSLEYATFFGEVHYDGCGYSGHDHVDGGTSRFDKKGNIIESVCASCGGCQEFPTSPGVWSESNGDGVNYNNCNNAAFKIQIIENLAIANFDPVPAGCSPYTVHFNNNSQGSVYQWFFGDGGTSSALNPTHTYTEGGTYQVMLVVSDPLSCNFADTLIREIFVMDAGVDTLPDIVICPGEQVVIGPEGNYGDASFHWLNPMWLTSATVQNPVASPVQNITYILVIDGLCNDTVYQAVTINQPPIDLFASSDTLICPGGTVTLHASSSYENISLTWSTSPSFNPVIGVGNTIIASPQTTTIYYVRAQEPECNTTLTEQIIVQVHQFNYTITSGAIVCAGGQTGLHIVNNNPSDILSYHWEPTTSIVSGDNSANPVVAPTVNTTYTVTVTNQIGCTTTSQVPVTINNITFAAAVTEDILCFGECTGTATVSATGIPPYTYFWSNQTSGNINDSLCSGSYTVTVTDNLQCTATQTVTINQPPLLVAGFTDIIQPECDGVGYGSASVTPSGGTPPYSYQWQFGGSNPTNSQLLTGDNSVTVTDQNGCDTVITVTMLPPGGIAAEIQTLSDISCFGMCDGSLTALGTSGTPPFTYMWSNGMQGSTINNLCSGPYIVSVIDSENCVIHKYAFIVQPDELIGLAGIFEPILCHGQTGSVQIEINGGTSPYLIHWSTGDNTNVVSEISAGSYSVTVTDAHNCSDTSEVEITQPTPLVLAGIPENMRCTGNCNGSVMLDVTGGTPGYDYNWSNGTNASNAQQLCEGFYQVTVTDNNGCAISASYSIVNEDYIPPLDVYADAYFIYRGESTLLHAIGPDGSSYLWSPPLYLASVTSQHTTTTPENEILYTVVMTDEDGCTNTDTVRIRVSDIICSDPFIYIPTAFTPNGDGENDYFKPYAPLHLITDMYFAVFDRWGEVVYASDNINDQGWDGTYKGKILPPDVYVFFFEATCLNQDHYNHKGNVTLIR